MRKRLAYMIMRIIIDKEIRAYSEIMPVFGV